MPVRRGRRLALLLALACAACGSKPDVARPPLDDGSPRLDRVWQIATHNSYWVDRGVQGDLFASGVQERLLDQLLYDHARSLEIDVHKDPDHAAGLRVYHTAPGNSLCDPLEACLAEVRTFHHAMPHHAPITLVVELKELFESNFDATHTVEDLDAALESGLGALLYRPADLLRRCDGADAASLGACVAAHGFPGVASLRGRVLVALIGNWDKLGGQATVDWVDYATHGRIRDRAAFPMASSWKLDPSLLTTDEESKIDPAELAAAVDDAPFLQIEAADDAAGPQWHKRNGIVRADGAVTADDQRALHAAGFQLLQTDTPWVQDDDRGPAFPLRALDPGVADAWLHEPGALAWLQPGPAGTRVFAHKTLAVPSTGHLEAVISGGNDASRTGCLRAASAAAGDAASVTLCRADRAAGTGADARALVLDVTTCRGGACDTLERASADAPGELAELDVRIDASGRTCVQPSAAGVDASQRVISTPLGAEQCFDVPLVEQGEFLPADSAGALFAGADTTGATVSVDDAGVATDDPSRLVLP